MREISNAVAADDVIAGWRPLLAVDEAFAEAVAAVGDGLAELDADPWIDEPV